MKDGSELPLSPIVTESHASEPTAAEKGFTAAAVPVEFRRVAYGDHDNHRKHADRCHRSSQIKSSILCPKTIEYGLRSSVRKNGIGHPRNCLAESS
jgi:hypothetical protein